MRPRRCLVSSRRHCLALCCLASRRVCTARAGPDSPRLQGPAGALLALLLVSAAALAMPAPTDAKAAAADPGAQPGATTAKAVPGAVNTKAAPGAKAGDAKAAATEAKTGAALDRAVEANVEAQDYQEETVPVKAQARAPHRRRALPGRGEPSPEESAPRRRALQRSAPEESVLRGERSPAGSAPEPEGVLGCSPLLSVTEEALVVAEAVGGWRCSCWARGLLDAGSTGCRLCGRQALKHSREASVASEACAGWRAGGAGRAGRAAGQRHGRHLYHGCVSQPAASPLLLPWARSEPSASPAILSPAREQPEPCDAASAAA